MHIAHRHFSCFTSRRSARLLHNGFGSRAFLLAAAGLLAGCMSMPGIAEQPLPAAAASHAAGPVGPATPPAPPANVLSYGTVTSTVQKGKTTQLELASMFGGPNISTTDADGTEVWIYERSVTQTDIATQSREYQGAVNLGLSFGHGNFGANAGGSGGAARAAGQSNSSTSTRTLTVIVKFNPDKTVKDYSVRATTF